MNDDEKQEYLAAFGARIRELRKLRGWTQEELATRCGYTSDTRKSTINKIEAGRSDLPASKIRSLADALGVRPSDLMVESTVQQCTRFACEIIEKCHGAQANEVVQRFLKLDGNDKQVVNAMIDSLLSTEKYKKDAVSSDVKEA